MKPLKSFLICNRKNNTSRIVIGYCFTDACKRAELTKEEIAKIDHWQENY